MSRSLMFLFALTLLHHVMTKEEGPHKIYLDIGLPSVQNHGSVDFCSLSMNQSQVFYKAAQNSLKWVVNL
jgi:hypothetical protein